MPKVNEAKKKQISYSDEFYSDLQDDIGLYAVLVRSPVEKGNIVAINFELPEGYFFFGSENLPAKKNIQTFGKKTPIFCEKEILYKGQPVGIICGPDLKMVKELRKKIEVLVEHEEIDEEESADENENILAFRDIKTGFFEEFEKDIEDEYLRENAITEKFESEKFCISGDYSSTVGNRFYGETNGAFVAYKAGKIKVFTPSLWLSHLRENLIETTGLGEDKIHICHTKTCAINNASLYLNTEIACQVAICAVLVKNSVKLVLSREEQNEFLENTAPVFISHRAAVSEEGEINALDVKITMNCGAYNPLAEEIVDRLTITSTGVYDVKNLRITAVAKSNPSAPMNFDMERFDSQSFFAIETFMQKIAFATGIPAVDLRLSNIRLSSAQKTNMPFLFQLGKVYECLDAVSRMSDFSRKHTVYRVSEIQRKSEKSQAYSPFRPPLRGIGLSCAFEGSVYFGTHFDRANVSVSVTQNKDDSITINSLPVSKSIKKIWLSMAEKVLEIPRDKVRISEDFDNFEAFELPELISRDIGVMTSLLEKCLEGVKNQRTKKKAPFSVRKNLSSSTKKLWSKNDFRGMPYHSQSFGCAVLELEFNPETFREEIRQITICIDGGKIISEKDALLTIKREVQNCLKELVKEENLSCPVLNIKLIESEKEPKQIGRIVSSLIPSAYASALSQSLSLTVNSLPLQTDSLYELLRRNSKKKDVKDDDFFDVLVDFLWESDDSEKDDDAQKNEKIEKTEKKETEKKDSKDEIEAIQGGEE